MQRRSLLRTGSLAEFREVLVDAACRGDISRRRRRAILVPTRASAELLRQTIEGGMSRRALPALVLPDLLTRDEWLLRLHAALPDGPRWLTRIEREVLLGRAAREIAARRRGFTAMPFHLRPGLVAAMLEFYDELRRRQRSVRRFARTLFDELRVERGTDRGSDGLIAQTCFLGFTFLAYQRAVAGSGGQDEHGIREALIDAQPALPVTEIVIAVADHPADPRGLWPADFDLLGRLRAIESIDVVVTEELHDAGFRDRLERELPGIEERATSATPRVVHDDKAGVLMRPQGEDEAPPCFVSRDREEELKDVARAIVGRARAHGNVLGEPAAIVFHRPLPYLYLSQQVLTEARLPYQAFDALPLAGEAYAALFDLVLTAARTRGSRDATLSLLRSRLMRFQAEGGDVGPADVAALDAILIERRASGDASTFPAEVDAHQRAAGARRGIDTSAARRAALVARDLVRDLEAFTASASAAAQVHAIAACLRQHERLPEAMTSGVTPEVDLGSDSRGHRARAAVLGAIDALEQAFARHDDTPRDVDTLTAMLHQAVESQTFAPERGQPGVRLVDAVAARFGDFADVHLVGLVDADWPERTRRSIFYTPALLKALGWPQDADRVRAQQAAFLDLLRLARRRTWLHAFQLEGDTVVSLSPMLEAARHLPAEPVAIPREDMFIEDHLEREPPALALGAEQAAWLTLRADRPPLEDPRYRGMVGSQPPQAYRVSHVDRYIECPFKYFAASVLGLPDDREDASGLTPLERGTLMHELFERFYRDWQADGLGSITAANLTEALARFTALARAAVAGLPPPDRALEETRLLGSIVARGLAERVFEIEIDAGGDVRQRLLEQSMHGTFVFPVHGGLEQRAIAIRGTADRIDVLADGSLRVIDYKLGRMPDLDASVQVAVYAHCARQMRQQAGGSEPPVQSAMYLAFGDPWSIDGSIRKGREPIPIAVETLAGAFADAVSRIEAGVFPPQPRDTGACQWCPQAGVCRKEYLVEDAEDGSTQSV